MIDETIRFDVCSQEVVSTRPERDVEILDESAVHALLCNNILSEQLEVSQVSLCNSMNTSWSNCVETLTPDTPIFRANGL